MSDRPTIAPVSPPLSHKQETGKKSQRVDLRSVAAILVVVGLGLAIIFAMPSMSPPELERPVSETPLSPVTSPQVEDQTPAPFAATQRQIARERAQAALAAFVETQLLLEDKMQVAQWGEEELAESLALARTGDLKFSEEDYEAALLAYENARSAMKSVVDLGYELRAFS